MKLKFRPAGLPDNNFFPEAKQRRVTGTVIAVNSHNCTVEWLSDGGPIRESLCLRGGVLLDKSLEVVR